MQTAEDLRRILRRIDRRGYKAYKDIEGRYDFGEYIVYVDHAQGDPFASPSRVRVEVPQNIAGFPENTWYLKSREIALRDLLTRRFFQSSGRIGRSKRGMGNSGVIEIDQPGQELLERTSAFVNEAHLEVRFTMGLPASGRTIAGREAEAMFFEELPQIVRASLFFKNLDSQALYRHIEAAEDADFLREQLHKLRLVAFVANGALLPRTSGVDYRPLTGERVVPFESPQSLRVRVELPNQGAISGMGIPEGVTLQPPTL
ncbi:MAG: hypothetical protein JXA46_12705 [Dehalococcoidales bacterium]|nr:hypothetical protein [Dehalococcoidales bacterium]